MIHFDMIHLRNRLPLSARGSTLDVGIPERTSSYIYDIKLKKTPFGLYKIISALYGINAGSSVHSLWGPGACCFVAKSLRCTSSYLWELLIPVK